MSFPRYPKYKHSGVKWLGEVPEHWESWKLAHAFELIGSGTTPTSTEAHWYEGGTIPWVTTGELRESVVTETGKYITESALTQFTALRVHPAGSLVIAMYGATIGRLGLLGVDAATNQACCILGKPKSLTVAFTYYWLQGFKKIIIDLFSSGGGQPNISQDVVSNLRVSAPLLHEQSLITDFLDRETAKIDVLVAEQEKLIALLKEKRQAVISHAVTKGLNPDAPLKKSGIEWIGEVPAHWKESRLSKLCHFRQGKAHEPFIEDGGKYICVNARFISTNGSSRKHCTKNLTPAHRNDILMVMSDLPNGRALAKAYFVNDDDSYAVNQRVCAISEISADPRFMYFLLDRNQHFLSEDDGMNQTHLSNSTFTKMKVFIPPLEEQIIISKKLDLVTKNFEELTMHASHGIELLRERRSALISAAVTGKIDVRQYKATEAA